MTLDCDGVIGGWRQIADLNPDAGCPAGFSLLMLSSGSICNSQPGPGCQRSLPFPVNGIEYSQVCGRIIGATFGNNAAFGVNGGTSTIDGLYVNGISLTYGTPPRTLLRLVILILLCVPAYLWRLPSHQVLWAEITFVRVVLTLYGMERIVPE